MLNLRKTLPPPDNANDKVMVVLSDGGGAVISLTTEKLAGRVGGMSEGIGILRKLSTLLVLLLTGFFSPAITTKQYFTKVKRARRPAPLRS